MAQTDSVENELPRSVFTLPQEVDHESLPSFRRLGLVQGLLIGLAVVVGFWLPKLIVLARLPLWFPYGGAIVSGLVVLLLGGLTGWLTSYLRRTLLAMAGWLVTAVLICISLGQLPPLGQNWAVWLADGRFAGLPVTPSPTHLFWWSYIIAGFLIVALLPLMALLQNLNLARAHQEWVNGRRLNVRASLILLAPALVAGFVGALFPDLTTSAPRNALAITDQAIQRVRNFEGDLFQLSRDTGFNYNALASVADQLQGPYTLLVNEVDDAWSSAVITAHFENGAWINCRINIDQRRATYLSFCFDAAIPFTDGLNHILQDNVPADSCRRCEVVADSAWQSWLQERASQFDHPPAWERVAQHGRFVIMQAASADNRFTLTCRLEGADVVQLTSCAETVD